MLACFFFSSRRRHTRSDRDWSSDVCSSDLEALRAIDELKNLASKTYVPALFFAPIYARLGEKEQAFQYLEKAFAERTDYLIFLGREPLSDPVRSDPRFDALLRRLGLPH